MSLREQMSSNNDNVVQKVRVKDLMENNKYEV